MNPVSLMGVDSNVTVSFTHRGTHNLVTIKCNVMHMLMFYLPQASHFTMSPNDAVATSDCFSTWTQHSDMNSGIGLVRLSSPTGLHSEHVDLKMHSNLWFLGTPRCNMKNMAASAAETVNSLTLDLKHKLWHHRLGHPG